MKVKLVGLVVALGILTSVPAANAAMITLNPGQTATFEFYGTSACPSCSAEITVLLGTSSLTFNFSNTSTDGTAGVNMLTAFGFDTTPNLTFGTAMFSGLPVGKDWVWATHGLGSIDFGAVTKHGVTDGLDGGQSGSVTVGVLSSFSSVTFDDTQVHIQALANGQSIKLDGCLSTDPTCIPTVPEPTSMLLLGTGLLGAGVFARRRKK